MAVDSFTGVDGVLSAGSSIMSSDVEGVAGGTN